MDDYVPPHLTVLPVKCDEDNSWLADARDDVLGGEAISQSEKAKNVTDKNGWHVRAGIAALSILDPAPAAGPCTPRPRDGEYHRRADGAYEETISRLHPLLSFTNTGGAPRYSA